MNSALTLAYGMRWRVSVSVITIAVVWVAVALFPLQLHAQEAAGSSGAIIGGMTYPQGSQACADTGRCDYQIPCQASMGAGGTASGVLVSGKCLGQSFSSDVASGQLLQQLMQAMQQLMQQSGGGGGASGGSIGTTTYTSGAGCTQYYQVTTPSSDPCAIYSPSSVINASTGGTSNVSSNLLDALNGGQSTAAPSSVSQTLLQNVQNTQTNTTTNTSQTSTQTQPTTNTSSGSGNTVSLVPGLSGDVQLGSTGATIFANLREGISEVASFFGGSTIGNSQSLSVAGRLCASRPWSGSFIANVIPSSFFDGLCEWRGYQVGTTIAAASSGGSSGTGSSSIVTNVPTGAGAQAMPQQITSSVSPEATIWAEPASVRLGTRTYIFWNARGVVSCTESGPSFTQNSLSGGASTVPISGPTTFSIRCLTNASTTVSDSVTVQIAI